MYEHNARLTDCQREKFQTGEGQSPAPKQGTPPKASAVAACPASGVKSRPFPWLCTHTGTESVIRLYEKGIEQVGYHVVRSKNMVGGGKRGQIGGLTHESARRLRLYLMENSRPGCHIFGVSLTLPGEHDPELWNCMVKRLRNDAVRVGVSYVWRIELQKRKVPHLHLIAWVPVGSKGHRIFSENWLEYLPDDRRNMKGVDRYCVEYHPIEDNNVKWFAYLVSHAVKKKLSQLGWKGKQWGIVGRRFMMRVKPETFKYSYIQRLYFQRTLKKMILKSGHVCRGFHAYQGYTRIIEPARVKRLLCWIQNNVK